MTAALVPELYVSNIERSLAFYHALGFETAYARPDERFAYVALGAAELMLEEPVGRAWMIGRLEQPYGRGINLQINVADANTLHRRVEAMKLSFIQPIEERFYQRAIDSVKIRQFVVADPDGYLLRFSETLA